MAELAVGYVSIVADTSKVAPGIKKALGGASGYGSDVGKSIGSKISSGIGKTLKAGVAGVGVAAGGALAGSIAKGLGRLTGIENARAKLAGLGNDAENVESIMDNALASVKGTSFGLGEAATTAAGAVAAGIKPGKELEGVLKSVANSAAATGTDLADMGGIFNKVASQGKAQNEVLSAVADRGLPIYQALADQFGVTADEVFKMASAGEIGFAEFEQAMKSASGTVAEELGGTTMGTLDNVSAAMGRFGEAMLAPVFSAAPSLFGSVISVFDSLTDAVKPVSEELGEKLTPALEDFAGLIESRVAPVAGDVVGKLGDIVLALTDKALDPATWETFGDVFTTIKDVVADLWPSIESLAGSFLTITQNVSVATWQILASTLDALAPLIESVLVPLVEKVAEFAENNPGVVEKMVMAFLGFKAVGAIAGPVGSAASTLSTLGGAVKGVSGAFKGAGLGKGLLNLMGNAKSANPILAKLGGVVGTVFKAFWKVMPVLSKVAGIFMKAIRFINPWVGALTLVAGALTYFFTKTELGQEIWQGLVDAVTGALDWIKEKFGEFTGWISDAWDGLKALFFEGDFTGALRDAFGWEEDNAFVNGILTVRDVLTGIPDLITGITDILFKGDFSGLPFGIEEDSGFVNFLFNVRDAVISAGDFIKKVFDGIWKVARVTLAVIATVILTPLLLAWEALSWGIKAAWEKVIKPAWDGLSDGITWIWENVLSPTFTWIGDKWQELSDTFSRVWEIIKTAVLDAWEAYWTTLKANFDIVMGALNTAWTWLKDTFASVWESIKSAVVDPFMLAWANVQAKFIEISWKLQAAWTAVKDAFLVVWGVIRDFVVAVFEQAWTNLKNNFQTVMNLLNAAWTWLKDKLLAVWYTIRDAVINAFQTALEGLRAFFQTIVDKISDIWNGFRDHLNTVWVWIRDNVFDAIGRGLDKVKEWFRTAVDAIRDIWNGIKSAAAKPVKFVVETVYNNGIRKAWNMVSGFVGLEDLDPVSLGDLGRYAKGGVLPGYTPGRDPYNFVDPSTGTRVALSGGEAIMRPEWTRAIGHKAVHAMNDAAVKGGINGVRRMLGGDSGGFVKAFAKGGVYENGDTKRKEEVSGRVVAAQDFVRREHGKPYQWGGVGNPSWDCSGLWSGIVQVINGGNGFGGRLFNTTSFMANPGAFGFSRGLHGPVTVGVSSDHMAGTLGGINAESASMPKGVQLGGSAWGSDNSYFPNQYTMDAILGEFISGGAGGGGGFNLGAMVKSLWDSVIDNIASWGGPGLIGKLPGNMLKTLAESAWNFIKERVGAFFGSAGEGGNRESWREMAMAAMRRNGFNADDPRQVDAMLDQIMSESGGIPDRNQEIVDMNGTGANAGQGLLQIIPGTFEAYRDPELPNDRTDPWANMNAALRYYRARYGDDLTVMWGHGHGYARGGVLPGFTPGRDVHDFVSPTGGALRLSGGEAIMRPEWTRAVGGAGAVNSMNRAATSGNAGIFPKLSKLPKSIGELNTSLNEASKELRYAYIGADWGYTELSNYVGEEFAKGMVNGVANLGEAIRSGEVDIAGLQEQGRKSAEDYAAEQASGLLSTFGLEGLVPLAQKAGAEAWKAYQASPYDVGVNGQTIVVEYVGDENDREWKMLQKLDKEVALLKAKRKPKASAMTRGGVQ